MKIYGWPIFHLISFCGHTLRIRARGYYKVRELILAIIIFAFIYLLVTYTQIIPVMFTHRKYLLNLSAATITHARIMCIILLNTYRNECVRRAVTHNEGL